MLVNTEGQANQRLKELEKIKKKSPEGVLKEVISYF